MTLRAFTLLALGGSALCGQVPDSTAVITASGLSMTRAEFEQLLVGDPRYAGALGQPAAKRALGMEFGQAFALEAEARRRKLDQSTAVQLRIRNFTQQLLAHELLTTLRSEYLADEVVLTRHYDENKLSFARPRVRQLLVRTPGASLPPRPGAPELALEEARAKAQALRAQLAAGADFAGLAKAESDDPGSRDKGGDVGFVGRGSTGANFEAAAYSLPVGELSEVVQTENGFHILRVEDRQPMPLAEVKARIANDLAHRKMDAILEDGFTLNDAYFPP